MFLVIYHKTTKKIVQHRHDMSVPLTHKAQDYFNFFLVDNEFREDDYTFAEVPFTKALNNIVIGNHIYNESSGQVEADPNYVAPTPVTPVEPTV